MEFLWIGQMEVVAVLTKVIGGKHMTSTDNSKGTDSDPCEYFR